MKTRIKVVDGVYYPQYRSWGMWFGIVLVCSEYDSLYRCTSVLMEAETAIDKYLKKCKTPDNRIIEYPLKD